MPLTEYKYLKTTVDIERLDHEIRMSSIVTAIDHIDFLEPDQLSVWFKDALSNNDNLTLDNLVTIHTGEPWIRDEKSTPVVVMEQDPTDPERRTGGHYQSSSIAIDVPASTGLFSQDFSFPIPISLLSASIVPTPDMQGDVASFYVSPDTEIGVLVQDATVGSGSFVVSQSVIDNIALGYEVSLYDGLKEEELGRVINISTNTIMTEFKTQSSFSASTPTKVRMSIEFVRYFEIFGDKRLDFGSTKIGGSYIPANAILRLKYNNKNGIAKRLVFMLEYLY